MRMADFRRNALILNAKKESFRKDSELSMVEVQDHAREILTLREAYAIDLQRQKELNKEREAEHTAWRAKYLKEYNDRLEIIIKQPESQIGLNKHIAEFRGEFAKQMREEALAREEPFYFDDLPWHQKRELHLPHPIISMAPFCPPDLEKYLPMLPPPVLTPDQENRMSIRSGIDRVLRAITKHRQKTSHTPKAMHVALPLPVASSSLRPGAPTFRPAASSSSASSLGASHIPKAVHAALPLPRASSSLRPEAPIFRPASSSSSSLGSSKI